MNAYQVVSGSWPMASRGIVLACSEARAVDIAMRTGIHVSGRRVRCDVIEASTLAPEVIILMRRCTEGRVMLVSNRPTLLLPYD